MVEIFPMDFIQAIMPGMSLDLCFPIYYYLTSTRISSHPVVQTPSSSSFLPITTSPSYTPVQHWSHSGPHQYESNRYSKSFKFTSSAYPPESQSLMPDSDNRLDHWDGHMFAEDLSPLAVDNCQLLPAFKDVFGNDLSPTSPTDSRPRLRKKKTTKVEAIKLVQNILLDADLTPTLLLLHLLGPDTSNPLARTAFFRRTNEDNICQLLSTILEDDKGSRILKKWIVPHAVDIVCDLVNEEMEAAKPSLFMTTAQTTPEFVEGWDINAIMGPIAMDITPTWSSVLHAASEPKGSHEKQSRNRPTVSFTIPSFLNVNYLFSRQEILLARKSITYAHITHAGYK
jgi:hypothetical protein